ncbi:helix-turn-helix domain-containing protein [Poseidonocella sedimentorum]|uniref:Transcriptional regulator, AraC family n=1 Tax=Poseidonocella sedimentorum TaxID=871652 RepID=A0A1I6E5G7_9RHOB|nr:helix-turn-helix domain-containing protein [Poseidonocella sedimentorum]SFR12973.1 transcriptional regulator, AraC family [Poseidonocella sedimentorum]
MPRSTPRSIDLPTYALYGERDALPDLCHVESIAERSRPLDWIIAPHRHSALVQFLHIARGGGTARFDGETRRFDAGVMIFVPRYCVHGFDFDAHTQGTVVTLPVASLSDAMKGGEGGLARLSAPIITEAEPMHEAVFGALAREHNRRAPFRTEMIAAQVRLLAVSVARAGTAQPATRQETDAVVPRFLDLIEAHFREARDLGYYAERLGRSKSHLNRLCTTTLQRSASGLLRDRVMLEARRELAYTNIGVAQVAYGLGFRDPAYFARVFRQESGLSPRAFRGRVQDGKEPAQ